ncbi:MAG: Rrf2 family transcriptional regulator [Lautropia sp.]
MKLTNFTDYSLRVLIYLAEKPTRRATIAEIATVFRISENHLVKVVHFLGRHGWIETMRGRGGGLLLTRPVEEISVGRVIRDTEGEVAATECREAAGQCVLSGACRLRAALDDAVKAFYAVLDRWTLADIAANRQLLGVVLAGPFDRAPRTS